MMIIQQMLILRISNQHRLIPSLSSPLKGEDLGGSNDFSHIKEGESDGCILYTFSKEKKTEIIHFKNRFYD